MASITTSQIKAIAGPGAKADLIAAIVRGWPAAVARAKITTKDRACHFLAEIMTETGGLKILSESGAYSEKQILKIFGARQYSRPLGGRGHSAGITPAEAAKIAALPVAQRGPVLFDRVYGPGNPTKAKEFNNRNPGDGWKYRGGGMMQTTGKNNYAVKEKETGLPLVAHPELLHQPDSAFKAAYLEWCQDGRCNAAADRDDVVAVRAIINGGDNGLAQCKAFLAKAKTVLVNYDATPAAAFVAPPAEPEEDPAPDVVAPPSAPPDEGDAVTGDPELFSVQRRLKARKYSPGLIDGLWGSGTSGALGGFINDRGGHIAVPASRDAFNGVREEIKDELGRAESEGWFRPVSAARASGDAATVATVAPEVVPVRRSFLTTAWASFVAFLAAVWDTISGYVSEAWDFFTDHKDDVPTDSGIVQTAWGYVTSVPIQVWLALAGVGLAFVAMDAWKGLNKIRASVSTGERQ